MSNILFNFFVNSVANCSSLSEITLSSNPYNFYTLSLNNFANSSADVSPVVATKYVILDNLSYITKIISFPATNRNFVTKSTVKCIYSVKNKGSGLNIFLFSFLIFIFFLIYFPSFYF